MPAIQNTSALDRSGWALAGENRPEIVYKCAACEADIYPGDMAVITHNGEWLCNDRECIDRFFSLETREVV